MPSLTLLAGKRVVVSGGTIGISRELIALLGDQGARVLTYGRHQREYDASLAYARGTSGSVAGLTADAASQRDVGRVLAEADRQWSGIDSGLLRGDRRRADIRDGSGRVALCHRSQSRRLSRLRAGGAGAHVRSRRWPYRFHRFGLDRDQTKGESIYAVSKAEVDGFAETLRKEVAERHIKVSLLQPGSVDTDMQIAATPKSARRSRARRRSTPKKLPPPFCVF